MLLEFEGDRANTVDARGRTNKQTNKQTHKHTNRQTNGTDQHTWGNFISPSNNSRIVLILDVDAYWHYPRSILEGGR
jgi:hypothetical protein